MRLAIVNPIIDERRRQEDACFCRAARAKLVVVFNTAGRINRSALWGQERCAVLFHYLLGVRRNNVGHTVKQIKIEKGVPTPCHNSGAVEKWHGSGSVVSWLTVKAQIT